MQEHILHGDVKKRRWDNGAALLNHFSFYTRNEVVPQMEIWDPRAAGETQRRHKAAKSSSE